MAIIPRQQIQDPQDPPANDDPQNLDPNANPNADPDPDPAPSYASADDVVSLKAQLANLQELLRDGIRSPQPVQNNQPTQPAAIVDVTDDEIEDIIVNGKAGGAKKLRIAMDAAVERKVRLLEQRLAEMEQFGVESIGNLAERVSRSDQKYLTHPTLGPLIKKEQEKTIRMLPRAKTDPVILKAIHDKVVGENAELLEREAVEKHQRQARGAGGGGSDPTVNNGRIIPKTDQTPTPAELIDSKMTVEQADTWARQVLGYRGGWEEYAAVIKKQREEGEAVH